MKAIKTTTIEFGLLSVPVSIAKASGEAKDVKFNMCDPKTGEALSQQYVNSAGVTFTNGSCGRSIDGRLIQQSDLDAIAEQTTLDSLAIIEVVPVSHVRKYSHRATGLYYVQSNHKKGSPKAFKLLVDALEKRGQAIVTKWTPRSRQQLLVLYPLNGNLMASAMEFADNMREPDEAVTAHQNAEYAPGEFDAACALLDMLKTDKPVALDGERDDALAKRQALVDKVLAGEHIESAASDEPDQPAKNADLADLLRASIGRQEAA
jgi:DNA end-binding protein Ku